MSRDVAGRADDAGYAAARTEGPGAAPPLTGIEHRKFGVGVFVQNKDTDELQAQRIVTLIKKASRQLVRFSNGWQITLFMNLN
jgi:hypothetical protein